ncbi:MAG: lytic murein transglycosylase [Rhodobacteraceae bacterium]|nr:lytic murein transglycosylase [Paracoccaceae bacterium]
MAGVQPNRKVLGLDRAQGVFKKSFLEFLADRVSSGRLSTGRKKLKQYGATFDHIRADYGIPAGVIASYWGLETDFGAVQGDVPTLAALVTLAHDCRRPDLFRPQIFAAYELTQRGMFDPARNRGAWAGEIGQFQMLPADVLRNGADGDGDGRVDVRGSSPDALLSAARMLSGFGWQPNQPWLQEITLPAEMDWSQTGLNHSLPTAHWAAMGVEGRSSPLAKGLEGAVLLPMGRFGPAFIAYPNYRIYFNWNKSFVYATTAAYFATRLEGAPALDARQPAPGLTANQIRRLQEKLQARGHDVGKIDGILGEKTREAVQQEQIRLGLPADAWPDAALLKAL